MEKITAQDLATAVIVAALQFRQKWDADLEVQAGDRALMTEEQQLASADSVLPEEMSEEDWWEQFTEFVSREGITKLLKSADENLRTISRLKKGERAFTLRAQDILATPLVRLWIDLARINPDCPMEKLNHAEGLVERMEDYQPQKWPD